MLKSLKKKNLAAAAAIGTALAAAMTALLCLPLAALIRRRVLGMDGVWLWAPLAAGLGVFLATVMVAGIRRRQGLPTGAIIAGGLLLLGALGCAGGGTARIFGPWLLRLGAACAAGGLLGAVMSIRRKPHKKRRSRGK